MSHPRVDPPLHKVASDWPIQHCQARLEATSESKPTSGLYVKSTSTPSIVSAGLTVLTAEYGFLSFIHPPSFLSLLDNDRAPKDLTKLVMACTLRQVSPRRQG